MVHLRTCFISWPPSYGQRTNYTLAASKKKRGHEHSRSRKYSSDDELDTDITPTAVSEADLDVVFSVLRKKLHENEEFLRSKISRLTLHRATPSLVESLTVELPNEKKEKQLQYAARIMTAGNYELHVLPLSPEHLDAIFVALSTKLVDYKVIMMQDRVSVVIPSMTEVMIRQARTVVKETLHEVRSRIRVARQDALKKLKSLHKGLSDDMFYRQQKEVDTTVKQSENRVEKVANDALRSLG
ncbi:uncharacterized protein BXIN_1951 [Babesia sp. Xinjiang]|uniref:uncharacterized protein n=1 Tax=Babesia sp. Xinjiang TaxID=462227 RepID=UPI000A21E9C7|nr:uncharacterized protein BXIN_1951 [Babesia sp. Xinjiang]ORM40458.1 hypothetical protein BXIN_1951 [Babesia sp. Xinjiang]